MQIPGQDNIPPKLGVRSYPVVERDHLVWIWMGDPAQADPALILDFPYLRDPAWRGVPDYMHYNANYLLIVDNLSDFAHLAFVHTKTLGGSEEYAFKSKPTAIERLERRLPRRALAHERARRRRSTARSCAATHRSTAATSHACTCRASSSWKRCSRRPARARRRATSQGAKQYRNCQFFTPETRRSTHFFWDYLHDYDLHDPTIALSLHDSMVEGFLEDKFIIEGQQEVLDADPGLPDERHRRRRAARAFPPHARQADRRRADRRPLAGDRRGNQRVGLVAAGGRQPALSGRYGNIHRARRGLGLGRAGRGFVAYDRRTTRLRAGRHAIGGARVKIAASV